MSGFFVLIPAVWAAAFGCPKASPVQGEVSSGVLRPLDDGGVVPPRRSGASGRARHTADFFTGYCFVRFLGFMIIEMCSFCSIQHVEMCV